MWGYPWTAIIVTLGSVVLLAASAATDRKSALEALALIGLSYPLYRCAASRKTPPPETAGRDPEES